MDKYRNAKYIFLIGIGGSNLATKAVWNAVTLHKQVSKKIFFLEAPDSLEYKEVLDLIERTESPEELVIVATSKSGKTEETLETFQNIFEATKRKFNERIRDRVVIISSKDTPLWKMGEENGANMFEWEGDVGGRFSAFTITHTLPLQIADLNTEEYLEGRKDAEQDKEKQDRLAQKLLVAKENGLDIFDIFLFNSELEDMGKWTRQLIAESLSLFTPTVSIGPTDLHSQLELTLGGPKNRLTLFVRSKKEISGSINEEAYTNVISAYEKAGLPFEKFEMVEINEREIGRFFEYMMETVLKFAKLAQIDALDQPAVDKYKSQLEYEN